MVETTSERRTMSENPTACTSASGGPQAARSTICGSLSAGTSDASWSVGTYVKSLKVSDSTMSVRAVTHSVDKVCYIRSDDFAYDKGYLDAYDFKKYEYGRVLPNDF